MRKRWTIGCDQTTVHNIHTTVHVEYYEYAHATCSAFFGLRAIRNFSQCPQFQWPFSGKHMCYAHLLIPHSAVLLEKPICPQLVNNFPHCIQTNCSSPCTSQSILCPCHQPPDSSPRNSILYLKIHFNVVHQRLRLSRGLFPLVSQRKPSLSSWFSH